MFSRFIIEIMSTFSINFLYLSLRLFSIITVSFCTPCSSTDRTYNCDCILETQNHTFLFDNNEQHNLSIENLLPALRSLHYCQGSFYCKPTFNLMSSSSKKANINRYLICFSDDSCLSNGRLAVSSSFQGFNDSCVSHDCMHLTDLTTFNITNEFSESGMYSCIKIGPQGLKAPFCLKSDCKRFVAIEKLCVCQNQSQNCNCGSHCEYLPPITADRTYALFLSFGDIYVSKGAKVNYFHWIVISVLSVGLSFLLLMFCKLCEQALYPANRRSRAQNTEALRRILASTLDSHPPSASIPAKESFSQTDRGNQSSPPPTYEQVLKDKVVEFKKSIA